MFPLTSPSIGLLRQTPIGDIKRSIMVLEVLRSRLQRSALSWGAAFRQICLRSHTTRHRWLFAWTLLALCNAVFEVQHDGQY
jgi:hypothetical protein